MLHTVGKKVGQIYINPVGLPVFLRPARAMRNNPPQRGGYQSLPNNRPERAMQNELALPFQGEI
jgi:hypothetical protein